jgi:outer membrane protein OmpA-like peptidoglycan-associated protein
MTKVFRKWLVAASIMTVVLAIGARANADGGLSLDQFQPAPAGDRFFGVQGGDPGGDTSLRGMLLGDYAYKPFVLRQASDDAVAGAVVKHQLFVHFAAGISLWDRLSVFANMPLALVNSGDSVDGVPAISGMAAGDLRLGARVRLVGENRSLATLSLTGYVFVPTGKNDKATGADEVHGMPALVLSGENDSIAYAANVGVDIRKHTDNTGTGYADFGSQLTFGAAVGVLLLDQMLQIGPEIYGSSLLVGSDKLTKDTTNLEGIVGVRLRVGPVVLGAGAGPGITRALGTPTLRGVVSVAYAPEPAKPAPPPPPPPPSLPPPPPPDRDNDGIYDKDDACPDTPGVKSDDPAKNGCPPPPPDRDGDGILDKDDACPDLVGVASADPSQNGCPPDTDGDGIRDDVDACPREKGKPDADPQKNGCPTAVRVTAEEIVILEQVQFKTNSATILAASDGLLMQVATVLAEHPEILKLEVQGHTDNRGNKKHNKKLSEKRAASVVKWLVKNGHVDASHLTSHGYGSEEPIADNGTADGRQKNRRVQFKIVEKTGPRK